MSGYGTLGGKIVVVTGADYGIGAACVVACAESGADRVVLLGREVEALEVVAERAKAHHADPVIAYCDVTSASSVWNAFADLWHVDVLINAAGADRARSFTEVGEKDFDTLFALNVRATFFTTQAAVRAMRRTGQGGTIINMSSQMGYVAAANRSVSCATKYAVEGLTKALAVELAPEDIRVLSIASTVCDSDTRTARLDDATRAALTTGTSAVADDGWVAR